MLHQSHLEGKRADVVLELLMFSRTHTGGTLLLYRCDCITKTEPANKDIQHHAHLCNNEVQEPLKRMNHEAIAKRRVGGPRSPHCRLQQKKLARVLNLGLGFVCTSMLHDFVH